MAKQATAFYKLPIDELRGKLATKQKPIRYSGQATNENPMSMDEGKHQATDFDKYIVLSKRRGKNRFYVKSRTSVGVTAASKMTTAMLACGASLSAHYLNGYAKASTVEQLTVQDIIAALDYRKGENQTRRDYLTKLMVEQIRSKKTDITVLGVPDEATGIAAVLTIGENPFAAGVGFDGGTKPNTVGFPATNNERLMIQRYADMILARLYGTPLRHSIVVVTPDLRRKTVVLPFESTEEIQESVATTFGAGYGMAVRERVAPDSVTLVKMTVLNEDGSVFVEGQPYADETHTTAIDATMTWDTAPTILYFA